MGYVHMLSCSLCHGYVCATSPRAHMHWACSTLLTDVLLHACVPPPYVPTGTHVHHMFPTFACLTAACGLHSHAPTLTCKHLLPTAKSFAARALEHTHW